MKKRNGGSSNGGSGGVRRISTMSGYAYEYTGKGDPMRGKADDWDIVGIGAMPGQLVGSRKIDGADCYVVRVRRDATRSMRHGGVVYYAQTAASLK